MFLIFLLMDFPSSCNISDLLPPRPWFAFGPLKTDVQKFHRKLCNHLQIGLLMVWWLFDGCAALASWSENLAALKLVSVVCWRRGLSLVGVCVVC